MNASDLKTPLRQELRRRRKALTAEARQQAEAAIERHLRRYCPPTSTVGGYLAAGSEANISAFLQQHAARVLLPLVETPAQPLHWREWNRQPDSLQPDALNMPAPLAGAVGLPDWLLVPVVGFDSRGYRLGQGGGYYDRSLAALRAVQPHLTVIGVAFACQQVEQLPADPWDLPLDGVVTEKGLVMFG